MDLKGTWVDEDNWGVRVGHGEHSSNPNSEKVKWLNKNSKLSLTITEQNGKAFTAKWCSPKKCESVVGVVKSNGDLIFADEDGYFQGTITKDNKIEMCYLEAGKTFQIAMCRIMKKK